MLSRFQKKLFSLIFGERSCGVPINSSKNADSFLTLRELRLFLHTFQREYMLRVASVIFFPCKDLPEFDFIYFSLLTFFIIIYHLLLWQWRDFTAPHDSYFTLYIVNELENVFNYFSIPFLQIICRLGDPHSMIHAKTQVISILITFDPPLHHLLT